MKGSQHQAAFPQDVKLITETQDEDIKTWIVCGSKFQIQKQYEILDPMGQGAYGIVVAAKDLDSEDQENNLVAIKKIERAFEHKVFLQRTLRELKILRLLQHENVLGLKTILLPPGQTKEQLDDIYLVSDLMETDLETIIRSDQGLTEEHIQFFLYQILRGLKYIHSAGILHRDLKPKNLLVNTNCDLKICDFGLARADISLLQTHSVVLTDYITTRWYRAPEVLLSWKKYSSAIDIWSVGCIFAEMLTRQRLFPGHEQEEQMQMIVELLGYPTPEEIEIFSDIQDKELLNALPTTLIQRTSFEERFQGCSELAVDLLKRMLAFDPNKRITVEQALSHPYLAELHCPDDEPTTQPVDAFDFDFEIYDLKSNDYRDLMYEEIMLYHSEEKRQEYEDNKIKYPNGMLYLRYANRSGSQDDIPMKQQNQGSSLSQSGEQTKSSSSISNDLNE